MPMNPSSTPKEQIISNLNQKRPTFLKLLGAEVTDVDLENKICEMHFDISTDYCHSIDIIQGGFVTAMLDAVSSHAVFVVNPNITALSTLELKVSYLAASRAGKFKAIGKIEQMTRNFAFLSAELFNAEGQRTAILSTTAKISVSKRSE